MTAIADARTTSVTSMLLDDLHRELEARPGPRVRGATPGAPVGANSSPVLGSLLDRRRMAHDASHFLLTPAAVVVARDGGDVERAIRVAARHRVPVTFRSGGTSLSGQAGGDGLLIDTRKGFRGIEVLGGGARVRCQPGATVRAVNARLAPYGRALGPDPASESACTIGGVVANNSSGMACGTTTNTYRTLASLEAVLLSGTKLDTSQPDADARLRHDEPALWEGLARLRDRVRANPESVRRIQHQFSMKNTMGYGLNSLLDFDEPAQILAHLLIGSEGTLAFILSATFDTVPVYPHVATALLVFDRIEHATDALPDLIAAGARTAELMDAASIRVAQNGSRVVPALVGLEVADHTALLVEAQETEPGLLAERVEALSGVVAGVSGLTPLARPTAFTSDPKERADSWHVRKGLYTSVAGARPAGSTALLEDVVVPMPALTGTVSRLGELCARYGYGDSVIFGHAKDANLHFMINPDLRDPSQIETYAQFTEDLVDLILDADGSLKAEHGTGRIMAPYVERQYGSELYQVMREIKRLCDPENTLNPGVVIGDDPDAHRRNLKVSDPVDPAFDRCVECGYCEPVCPSRDLTTTPRQRIALMRDMNGSPDIDPAQADELRAGFGYAGIDTCAVDSLCVLACPVAIDTGKVMKGLRARRQSGTAQKVGKQLANSWGPVLSGLRLGLGIADRVPDAVLSAVTGTGRKAISPDLLPYVGDDLPGPGFTRRTEARSAPGEVVLFASCIGELFEPAPAGPDGAGDPGKGAALAFVALCDRAGIPVQLPKDIEHLCCATVWRSKGLTEGRGAMAVRTARSLLRASDEGRIPIACDASSCTHGLHDMEADLVAAGQDELAARFARLTIVDANRFVLEKVLPRLTVRRELGSVVVHPTCSDRHAGDVETLAALARACAREVTVPVDAGCCGFAGDRGMLHPELTASATGPEAREVKAGMYDAYASSNRTCEIGMSRATGRTYRHVLELLEEATRP